MAAMERLAHWWRATAAAVLPGYRGDAHDSEQPPLLGNAAVSSSSVAGAPDAGSPGGIALAGRRLPHRCAVAPATKLRWIVLQHSF